MDFFTLLATSRSRTLRTQTFTSDTKTWVAPATTDKLESLTGKGQDGQPSYSVNDSELVAEGYYFDTGSGNTEGPYTWSELNLQAATAVNRFNNQDGPTYFYQFLLKYPSSYSLTSESRTVPTGIPGTASLSYSGDWGAGDDVISGDGTATMLYQVSVPATSGAAASGFGYSFAGGAGGTAATTVYNNVAVTPNASYALTVPTGGSITIEYYE